MTAGDIMKKQVVTVAPAMRLRELARLLAARGISGAPVVGPEGDLVGMVSQSDLLRAEGAGDTVESVMTPWAVSFEEDTDIETIARQMLAKRIHRVAVTRDGRLSGIITSLDLIRGLSKALAATRRSK